MSFGPKETLRPSEANTKVARATDIFFAALARRGIRVEEGELDGGGKPFTRARLQQIRQRVDAACWGILKDNYTIDNN